MCAGIFYACVFAGLFCMCRTRGQTMCASVGGKTTSWRPKRVFYVFWRPDLVSHPLPEISNFSFPFSGDLIRGSIYRPREIVCVFNFLATRFVLAIARKTVSVSGDPIRGSMPSKLCVPFSGDPIRGSTFINFKHVFPVFWRPDLVSHLVSPSEIRPKLVFLYTKT